MVKQAVHAGIVIANANLSCAGLFDGVFDDMDGVFVAMSEGVDFDFLRHLGSTCRFPRPRDVWCGVSCFISYSVRLAGI